MALCAGGGVAENQNMACVGGSCVAGACAGVVASVVGAYVREMPVLLCLRWCLVLCVCCGACGDFELVVTQSSIDHRLR